MNCVFDIKLNAPMNAYECVAYTGEWCEFCGEDNGGCKFCYNCGQRKEDEVEVEVEEENQKNICSYCKRNEEKCEEEAENEKNPITEWCGWGLSCDDCYYKNHPESDDEEEEEG
jgi:hypothetical protein